MKRKALFVLAGVGAVLSSAIAMAVPMHAASSPPVTSAPPLDERDDRPDASTTPSHFSAGSTLLVDARLGHRSLAQGGTGETYLFASVTGVETAAAKAPPLDLAIVMDRSGSMKGEKTVNAMAAAIGAVERMRDGDSVLVITFDTEAQVVVPRTVIDAATRSTIPSTIRSIRMGGDTCISCGLEEAKRQLDRAPAGGDRVTRMMLLSDGATNRGVQDTPGLRVLAARLRDRGCPITTIGVDVDFDERVMGALSTESNGNHYFVANPTGLPAVFNKEFDTLIASVARDAEVVVDLAPGVVLEQVFDRPFRREGERIRVPLGSLSAKDERTVLVKLRVPVDHDGTQPVADVKITYRDLRASADDTSSGSLALAIKSDGTAQRELDPFVYARVERSITARTLSEANDLMNLGKIADARARLASRSAEIDKAQGAARQAPHPSPKPARARSFGQDLDDQAAAVNEASRAANSASTAAPSSRPSKTAAKDIKRLDMSDPFK